MQLKWSLFSVVSLAFVGLYSVFAFLALVHFPTPFIADINWLSDLGGKVMNPQGGVFFNLGCIFGGVVFFIVAGSLSEWRPPAKWQQRSLRLAQLMGCVSAFGMMMIGFITEDEFLMHITWAGVFFVCLSIFIVLESVVIFPFSRNARIIALIGLAVAAFDIYFDIWAHSPLMELIAVILSLAFIALLGIYRLAVNARKSTN